MSDRVITLKISDEAQHEFQTLADKLGYPSIDAYLEASQSEIQKLIRETMQNQLEAEDERLWDEQFENSQDVLDMLAEEIRKERRAAREKLANAGILATELGIPEDLVPITDEELEHLGEMSHDARSSEDLLDEDRGTY